MLLFVQPSGNTLHGGSYICVRGCKWHNEKIYMEAHCEDWNSCSHSTKWSREKHSLYSKSIVNGINLFFTIINYPKPCLDSLYSTKKILSMSSPQQRRKPHWSNRITWAKEEGHVIIMFSIFFFISLYMQIQLPRWLGFPFYIKEKICNLQQGRLTYQIFKDWPGGNNLRG